jgi:DDE superfamily endonuclease
MASRSGPLSGSDPHSGQEERTVSAALRVMGLGQTEQFQGYHRVLNRAVWSGRESSCVLLGLLVRTFVPSGPLVIGVDETLERRWGKKIAAKGVYRDPVRSTQERASSK